MTTILSLGRVFPVSIAYSTEQPRSYFETAVETVMDLHCSQGPGDILLFLTGRGASMHTTRFRSHLRLDRGKHVLFIGGERRKTDELRLKSWSV